VSCSTPRNLERRDGYGSGPGDIHFDIIEEDHTFRSNPETRQRLAVDGRFRLVTTELMR
jgi:hypothetical protein